MTKIKRNTLKVRVDPDSWSQLKQRLGPDKTNAEISRLWNKALNFNEWQIPKNKEKNKGSIQDAFFIIVVLLIFAVFALLGGTVMNKFNDKIQASDTFTAQSKTISTRGVTTFNTTFDSMGLLMIVFLSIAVIILASLIIVHPVFLVIYIVFFIFLIIGAGMVSNIYEGFETNEQINPYASELTFIPAIMHTLPIFAGVLSMILAIVMYRARATT